MEPIGRDLEWPAVVLIVLVQGERQDPAESLRLATLLSDASHERHDHAMTWLRKLGFLQAGAPHFCLTLRGRVMLAALRRVVNIRPARDCNVGSKQLIAGSGHNPVDRSPR